MVERVYEAIVLDVKPRGEFDKEAVFFSRDLGKFRAVLVGGRRTVSKFSPHCGVLDRVLVRVVYKNRYTVTDVIREKKLINPAKGVSAMRSFILAHFLEKNLPDESPDEEIWERFSSDLKLGSPDFSWYISRLGYGSAETSSCVRCGKSSVNAFVFGEQGFVCRECSSKIPENELLLL